MKNVGQFMFVSHHGCLLQGYTNGEMHASQDVSNVGEEERWHVHVWEDGKVSLQNFRTNRFLCAEPSGRAVCDRTNPDAWERWSLHARANRFALKSIHGTWLCAQPPAQDTRFGGEVIADRKELKDWETFSMVPSEKLPLREENLWNTIKKVAKTAGEVIDLTEKLRIL